MPHMANLPWMTSYLYILLTMALILCSISFNSNLKMMKYTYFKETQNLNNQWKW